MGVSKSGGEGRGIVGMRLMGLDAFHKQPKVMWPYRMSPGFVAVACVVAFMGSPLVLALLDEAAIRLAATGGAGVLLVNPFVRFLIWIASASAIVGLFVWLRKIDLVDLSNSMLTAVFYTTFVALVVNINESVAGNEPTWLATAALVGPAVLVLTAIASRCQRRASIGQAA
jgi:NO-binding membrane sensor protein with MHYT domain